MRSSRSGSSSRCGCEFEKYSRKFAKYLKKLYNKLLATKDKLEEYVKNILSLKIKIQSEKDFKDIIDDYERFDGFI